MEDLLIRYGALAILVGTAFEGDMTAILAGVIAHLGLIRLPRAIALAALGAFAGDCLYYTLGRRGARAIRTSGAYARVEQVIERLAGRLGPWEIPISRWVYGTRVASMVFWGVRGLPLTRFVAVDVVGCVLWASALVSLGFWSSSGAVALLGEVRRLETWLLAACALAAAAVLAVRAATRRRLAAATHGTRGSP